MRFYMFYLSFSYSFRSFRMHLEFEQLHSICICGISGLERLGMKFGDLDKQTLQKPWRWVGRRLKPRTRSVRSSGRSSRGRWTRTVAVHGFEAVRSRLVQTDCGHKLRTGAVRGFQPERSLLEWIGRGPRPRTEPVRGRYQDQVTHLFLSQTRVCRVDPIRILSYYKQFQTKKHGSYLVFSQKYIDTLEKV